MRRTSVFRGRRPAELVRRAAAGERDAFAAIYERYRTRVYRFARLMSGSSSTAEDVPQEVFVTLMRTLVRYEPQRAELLTYLYGRARNVTRNQLRRERRFVMLDAAIEETATNADDPARKVAMRSPISVIKRTKGVAKAGVSVGAFPAAPIGAQTFMMNTASNDARTESLGTSEIEGVQAQGTRTVVTIPAGAIGNQAPIEMVAEQWYSAELGTVVVSRRSDPRFGETTYRLQNIMRAEPSPDLFQLPSDYTVEALPAFGGARFIGKPPAP